MNRDELIRRVKALPFDAAHFWLVAGGAMVLHGLRAEAAMWIWAATARWPIGWKSRAAR